MDISKFGLIALGMLSLVEYTEQSYCSKYTGTPGPNDPSLPSLPPQYQTKIEANIYDKGKTVTGYEYFDNTGNRAMLGMVDAGVLHKLIFDYGTDELFYVTGDSCSITSLKVDDNNLLFGNNFTRKGIPHVFTSGGALHFAASFGEHYLGNTTVRGIVVDHWQSCLYWEAMLSNFTLDYYFTVRNWSDPINYPQIPVRALARGVQEQPDKSLRNFTHYYDYVDFKIDIKDYTVFETPEGILCTGRNKTKPLPDFHYQDYIHYKLEIVDKIEGKVFYREEWYDGQRNYTRRDYRGADGGDPLTDINDFNYGTKYTIDQVSGKCQIQSLNQTDWDVDVLKYDNGTSRLTMSTIKEVLQLDDSYAYTGQRMARNILCDVYSGEKTNFLKGSGRNVTAVIDFFFMSEGWKEYGDDKADTQDRRNTPIQLIASIDALGLKFTSDFMDVSEMQPKYSVMDVSPCYPESSFIEFTVKLQGDPKIEFLEQIRWGTQGVMSSQMGVSPIRVQRVNIDYDVSFVYVSAKLLPPFTPRPDMITAPTQSEPSSQDAYNRLVSVVYTTGFNVTVSYPYCCQTLTYTAVDISVQYGKLKPQTTPILTGQFSYGLENSVPNIDTVFNSKIWYDYDYKLVRYDTVSGDPISTIHDYNSGLAYTTDQTTLQCTVSRISNSSFDVLAPSKQQVNQGGYTLKLRNPLQIFDLTNGFNYVGQKTIRGIMCDVYENVANFSFGGTSKLAVYQFYFMTSTWNELSKDSGVTVKSQPISMIVTSADASQTEYFDFYDFSEQHPDLSSFNIQPCFTGNQRRLFLIRFNQTYHPYLDEHSADFLKNVQRKLSILTNVSPLRFQNGQVSHNGPFTYYLASMVQQAPDILDFTKTSNMQGLYSMDATFVGVKSDDDCAGYCRNMTAFACQSFNYCAYKGLCQLSKLHTADGNQLKSNGQCDHYSRTVQSTDQVEPSNNQAMVMLQDIIARSGFNVTVNISDTVTATFPAIKLSPNLITFENNKAGRDTLSHFRVKPQSAVDQDVMVQEGLFSIDDCAKKCLATKAFTCDSYIYCQLAGECILSDIHPDVNVSSVTYSFECDLYIRKYTDKYVKYEGVTTQTQSNMAKHGVLTADACAKGCFTNTDISCKSFDYCPNTQTCYLKTSHILQLAAGAVSSSSDCSHYSKMYLYDFTMTPNRAVSDGVAVNHILFYNVSVENCARLCVENYGYSCKAFSFCGNSTQCVILSTQAPITPPQTTTSDFCDLYTRQYFADSMPVPVSKPATQSASTGFSSGSMAGVAIGTLFLGMLLGVALLYFFRTKQLVKRQEEQEMDTISDA